LGWTNEREFQRIWNVAFSALKQQKSSSLEDQKLEINAIKCLTTLLLQVLFFSFFFSIFCFFFLQLK